MIVARRPLLAGRLQRRSARRAKGSNIPHWRLPEEAAVFAVELTGALVSDLECSARGVEAVEEHPRTCSLQPKLFLVLKGAHRGERSEMIVKRGNAHARHVGQLFHAERFCEVRLDPGDRLRRSLALVPSCCDCSEPRGVWPLKYPVDNFTLNQSTEK